MIIITDEVGGAKPGMLPLVMVAIVIFAALGGLWLYGELKGPDINPDEVTAFLIIDYGNGTVEEMEVTTVNNTIPGMLAEGLGASEFSIGRSEEGVAFIRSIGEAENNVSVPGLADTSGMWWVYTLNGTQAPVTWEAFEVKDKIAVVRARETVQLNFKSAEGPSGVFEEMGISVRINIDYGNGTYLNQTIVTDNYTSMGSLEKAVGYENLDLQDFGWGIFVNGINGVSTGSAVEGISDTTNYYWLWYINDGYASVGAGDYVLQDGDVVDWKFEGF